MAHDFYPISIRRQRGRKSANKSLMCLSAPLAPPHFSEAERVAWEAIVSDPSFRATTVSFQTTIVAVEALTVVVHIGNQIREITAKGDLAPRRLYETLSRSVRAYTAALRLLGLLPR